MLKFDIKRKINTLRDILVGKVPDPKAQVEQITIAMIYKFMDDIDLDGMEFGLSGAREFFKDGFEKYAWSNIMLTENSGQQRAVLFAEGIDKMAMNPHLPQLFRDIFRGAYVPYRDPDTLNMFLKEISEFSYNNSEDLGNAFEYLLSIMGSQGDAGQFRTPRHIIDMIAKIVDPKKNETVLDPACGTAGFLISAYKHILEHNKDENGKITLTADDRKRLSVNFAGYDISPDMVRLSRVNMYLHKFTKPQISEYDTLTSEEKWDDSFDVILANPPFMTPKGGIIPHNRYRVGAKRAEVLFVDYIAEHLNPTGRAGIIVPEGIVFQSANAYKQLREYLVKDNLLYAVISLPAGVFNPYSGVKTSVLLFDKTFAKQKDEILFVKMTNDGYDLGAQRREIKKDDIPDIVNIVKAFKNGEDVSYSPLATIASKEDIAKQDYILVGERYKAVAVVDSQWPLVELGEVAEYINGFAFKPTDWTEEGTPIIRIQNLTNSSNDINRTTKEVPQKYNVEKGDLLISWSATIGFYIWHGENAYLNQHIFKVNPSEKILKLYLFCLRDAIIEAIKNKVHGNTMTHITKGTFDSINIPLPPLSVQEKIVAEIESYQKIIDGAKQVMDNYKPTIKIDPSWEMVKLGDVCSLQNGYAFKSELFSAAGIQVIKMGNVQKGKLELNKNISYYPLEYKEELKKFILGKGDILISLTGTQGKEDFGNVCMIDVNYELFLNQRVGKFEIQSKDIDKNYLYLILQMDSFRRQIFQIASGVRQGNISKSDIEGFGISLPPLEIQHKIVKNISEEIAIVEQNKRLIEIFNQKIKDKIKEVWGE